MTELLQKDSELEKLKSLKDFIEESQRLVAVIGVFVALALFWKVVLGQNSAPYISYLCLLATVPLLIEINKGYDYHKSSWNLVAFVSLLYGILAYTSYYLIVGYPDHLHSILVGLVFSTICYTLFAATNRFFNAMKTREYSRNVKFYEALEKSEIPQARRNEVMKQKNEDATKYYRSIDRANTVVSICVLVLSLSAAALVSDYIRASLYLIFNITPQINALPLR
jgi:hypothetical protein